MQLNQRKRKQRQAKQIRHLAILTKLYRIERQFSDLKVKSAFTDELVVAYQQDHSIPIRDKLKSFSVINIKKVPDDSLTGNAICSFVIRRTAKLNGLEPY